MIKCLPLILPNMGNDIITSVEFTSDSFSNLGDGYLLVGRESLQAKYACDFYL